MCLEAGLIANVCDGYCETVGTLKGYPTGIVWPSCAVHAVHLIDWAVFLLCFCTIL
jgi:hypothetical protein